MLPAACPHAAFQRWLATIPSAVFEASVPGVRMYTPLQRVSCLGVKFLEYSLAGMVCGLLGQGIANSLMLLKCAKGKGLGNGVHLGRPAARR